MSDLSIRFDELEDEGFFLSPDSKSKQKEKEKNVRIFIFNFVI